MKKYPLEASAPDRVHQRLRHVENEAHNLEFSRDNPSLAKTVELRNWDNSGRMLWPQRHFGSLAAAFAQSMIVPRYRRPLERAGNPSGASARASNTCRRSLSTFTSRRPNGRRRGSTANRASGSLPRPDVPARVLSPWGPSPPILCQRTGALHIGSTKRSCGECSLWRKAASS